MASFRERLPAPEKAQRLKAYLSTHMAPYRVPVLLRCGDIYWKRKGRFVRLWDPKMLVRPRDEISLRQPASDRCRLLLERIPQSEFRDYGFAPHPPGKRARTRMGSTYTIPTAQQAMHWAMSMRPGMVMYSYKPTLERLASVRGSKGPSSTSIGLSEFMSYVRTGAKHPIRALYVSLPSDSQREIMLYDADTGVTRRIPYNGIDAHAKMGTADSFRPSDFVPRPSPSGRPTPLKLHLKGAPLGTDTGRVLLGLFKDALNWRMPKGGPRIEEMTAPRHLHRAIPVFGKSTSGMAEYMAYEFELSSPVPLTRDRIIQGFATGDEFKDIDGGQIPEARWRRWIPAGNYGWKAAPPPLAGRGVTKSFVETVTHPLLSSARKLPAEFKQEVGYAFLNPGYFGDLPDSNGFVALGVDPAPTKDADFRAVLDQAVAASNWLERYKAGHAFPVYRQMGFSSLTTFLDAFTFSTRREKWKNWQTGALDEGIVAQGLRYIYRVRVPITSSGGRLYINFFPADKDPKKVKIEMRESDARFFGTV